MSLTRHRPSTHQGYLKSQGTNASETLVVGIIASFAESLLNFRGPLLKALVAKGYRVSAYAPRSDATADSLAAIGVTFQEIPLNRNGINPLTDLILIWRLFRRFRADRPDVVLSYTIKPVIYGTIAAKLAHVPITAVIVTGLGYLFTGGSRWRSLIRLAIIPLYRTALSLADCIFFQNSDDISDLRRYRILAVKKSVTLIPGSGVDLNHFSQKPPPDQLSFLMIARLVRDKGVLEYVEASRRLRELYPNVPCRLVGGLDTNPSSISQDQLRTWVREGTIDYLGEVDDVRPLIEASAVYVLPSYREGMPRTILEAMAIGRPIITTDAPGCRDTIINGESGLLVPPRNVDELVSAMSRFVGDPDLAHRMSYAARKRAEDRFGADGVNSLIIREIDSRVAAY